MTEEERSRLSAQIESTLHLLRQKAGQDHERIITTYLHRYEAAFQSLNNDEDTERHTQVLLKLLNCARGYLETASNWQQPFLDAMGETEAMIEDILKSPDI